MRLLNRLIGACVLATVVWSGGCDTIPVLRADGLEAYRVKDYDLSRAKFNRVLEQDATDWKSHWFMGKIALDQGKPDEARMHLEQAYTLRGKGLPRNIETDAIVDDLAEALYRLGDGPRCIGLCDEAIRNYGLTADYMRKGDMLQKLGDPDSAIVAYLQAAKIGPSDDPRPWKALADVYETAGNRAAALDALKRAYALEPRNQTLQARIIALGGVPGPTFALPPGQ